MSSSHDLDETLGNVVDLVAKRLDTDVCSVYLTAGDLANLNLAATKGLARDAIGRVTLRFGEGLVGIAAATGEPVAVEDAHGHPGYRYFPETGEERYSSLMAAPLLVSGVVIGVIAVQTVQGRSFSREEVELLRTCAQLIAPLVMNAEFLALVNRPEEDRSRVVEELTRSGMPTATRRGAPQTNQSIQGIPTSRGVAIGPVYFLEDPLDL
ncbi:MAG: GAF domain-containing protein, partial [Myxococcales bacterium]|nr:GAF domain-containing protein [Myxococcales bacterium]